MASRQALRSHPGERMPDWNAVERAYQAMTTDQLLAELARVGSLLERQTRSGVSSLLQDQVSRGLDQPVTRRTTSGVPSPPSDRGRPPSPRSQPGALDLLISGRRIGPRLAAKLVQASSRGPRARTR